MKKITAIVVLISIMAFTLQAQPQPHKANLYLKVTDFSNNRLPFLKVSLRNIDGTQPQYSITDINGNATFNVITGNNYQIYITDSTPFTTINIPLNSLSFVTKKMAIPNEIANVVVTKTTIDTINQSHLNWPRPDTGNIFFKVGLFNHVNQAIKNMEVRIYDNKTQTVYLAKTNNYGYALFNVPGKTSYTIGVDKFENFETVTVPHYGFALSLTYIPTKILEIEVNDTIKQLPDKYMRTTTDRALVKIHLKDHDNKALANEQVYFNVVGSEKVYKGKTGTDGVLTMLLPKGQQYELNFTYERAVKLLDYPLSPTLYTTQFFMTYIGTQRVDDFYNTATRTDGFRTEFMDCKVSPVKMDRDIIEITPTGFHLNFPDDGPILTPAIQNDKLMISAGYYNPDIYCIHPETGAYQWGLKLAENGASVMVVEDGMLLINTQSCTLYAIDIENGMLAWSKWLGPNIYHSPTVANGKVFAVYPDAIGYATDNFVLVAFDLKTGSIVWQNRLKSEPLSSPVAAGSNLYLTDLAGFIYSFDLEKGSRIAISKANAVSVPVFFNNNLWVNIRNTINDEQTFLAALNPVDLSMIQRFESITDSVNSGQLRHLSASTLMGYSRSRIIADSKQYYQINNHGLQAFKRENSALVWTFSFANKKDAYSYLTFAGTQQLLANTSSKLLLINSANGNVNMTIPITGQLTSEPAINKGWVYYGTQNGKFIALNTKNKLLDGWPQFGMNANHNPVK